MEKTFKRVELPDTGGAEVLLRKVRGDFEAVGYSRTAGSAFTNLPQGYYEDSIELYDKYVAWAYHAEQVRGNAEQFDHATRQMAAISVKYGK